MWTTFPVLEQIRSRAPILASLRASFPGTYLFRENHNNFSYVYDSHSTHRHETVKTFSSEINKLEISTMETDMEYLIKNAEETCPICLNVLLAENMNRTLVCKHTFCNNCINTWTKEHPNCPMCRREVLPLRRLLSRTESMLTEANASMLVNIWNIYCMAKAQCIKHHHWEIIFPSPNYPGFTPQNAKIP